MNTQTLKLHRQIKFLTIFFMISLAISGLTAIPAREGVVFLLQILPASWDTAYTFLMSIRGALFSCDPTLFYGYDWLAFAHLVIALLFIGVIKDPIRNIWIIQYGMIVCILIIPFAFVMGQVRGIPVWWRLIDCSFGVVGIIPLWFAHTKIEELQKIIDTEKLNTVF
jgi:asparagine N-glycosylation enzyme membrane subunit Stt3